MVWIIVDVEATCWAERNTQHNSEIIEIGAVKVSDNFDPLGKFSQFVRPMLNPTLSDFCTRLTSIRQQDVDEAGTFAEVFPSFMLWVGDGSYRIASWGDYDIEQLHLDCKRHHIPFPKRFRKRHLNLKLLFAEKRHIRPCGMDQALSMMHMPIEGTHHRAIDDVRNITRIARVLLK